MENDDVPDWAIERACELANDNGCGWTKSGVKDAQFNGYVGPRTMAAFARYIAQHEKPPVDPDLMLAREIAALVADHCGLRDTADVFVAGDRDQGETIPAIVKLLKERK